MSENNQAKKKKIQKKKISKEDKYKNLLDQIDINLDNDKQENKANLLIQNDPQSALNQYMEQSHNDDQQQEISINDLMGRLEENNNEQHFIKPTSKQDSKKQNKNKKDQNINQNDDKTDDLTTSSNTNVLRKQMEDLKKKQLLQEPESLTRQERQERMANYKIVKEDMNKWIPIVKRNREAEHLDFTNKENIDNLRVNTVMGTDLQHPIAKAIEGTLKKGNLESEKSIKQKEKPLSKEQRKQLAEKNLMFYQELKHKRVAKIKSKMYHRIKNKKLKKLQNQNQELNIEQLEEDQVRERIQNRHKSKGKGLRQLMRFGDKKQAQQAITANADMRKQILQKIMQLDEMNPDDYDSDDDNAFREKAIKELEKELVDEEATDDLNKDKKKTGLKFIDDFNEQRRGQALQEAKKLLQKLKETEKMDDLFSEDDEEEMENEDENNDWDLDNDNEENLNKKRKNKKNEENTENEEFEGRKKFKPNEQNTKKGQFEIEMEEAEKEQKNKKLLNQNASHILKGYLKDNEDKEYENLSKSEKQYVDLQKNPTVKIDDQQQDSIQQEQQQEKNNTKTANKKNKKTLNTNDLTKGINLGTLQDKYKKNLKGAQLDTKDLETFDIENKEEIYKDLANFNILVDNENEEQFMKDKYEDYEKDIVDTKPKLTGWGSWCGEGIKKKAEPTPEELQKRKQIQIEAIKKKRSDGQLDNVIKRETRNKAVTQYLVKELPHQYKTKEQFEYVNNAPIGSEWNTLRTTNNLIKPKIKTKAGQIIKPITAPRKQKDSDQ